MTLKPLTDKQARFVDEYLIDLNATQAAIRAGYSQKTARSSGHENLTKPDILDAITVRQKERRDRLQFDADKVLQRLIEIDDMDVADILTDEGTFRPISSWPEVWRKTVCGIDINEASDNALLKRITWPDKLRNLELLGKHSSIQAFAKKNSDEPDSAPILNINLGSS